MTRQPSARGIAQVVMLALPLIVGILIAVRGVDVPSWDEWEWADLIYAMHTGTLQFANLWAQHSEHRMLFPELIMLGLDRVGGWHPIREQFVSLFILILSQIALIAIVRKTVRGTIGVITACVTSFLLYSLMQAENFDWGFQTAWFLCNACAIAVALCLTKRRRSPLDVVCAIVLAVIASFSSSQGLVVWVVGAVAIVFALRKPAQTLAIWIPSALVTYMVYRHGMFRVDEGHINAVTSAGLEVRYIFAYLGAPLAGWLGANGSALAGIAVTAALIALVYDDLRSPAQSRRFVRNAPWYALASYPLLCAAATASGRAGLGLDQSLSSRYTTISTLLWIVVVVLAAERLSRYRQPLSDLRVAGLMTLASLFVFAALAGTFQGWSQWHTNTVKLTDARSGLLRSDPSALTILYPDPQRITLLLGKMREIHDGPFAGT